jgi:serine/threonine-protein kinase
MEMVKGDSLDERIAGGPLRAEAAIPIALQIAKALEAAHDQGVVHRDLKPANVKIRPDGTVKVLDFGLAKVIAGQADDADLENMPTGAVQPQLTRVGSAMGTVSYMSPEQARCEEVDARSDLFSLGALLHEMCTGQRPFGGSSTAEIFASILRSPPPAPRSVNPEIPDRLEEIILKALEKDQSLRYQHASEIRTDMRRLLRDLASGELPFSDTHTHVGVEVPRLPVSRRMWFALAAVAVGIVAALGTWIALNMRSPPAQLESGPMAGAVSAPESTSVAVLPFVNLSPDPDQEYFSDGLAEEVLNLLAKIPQMRVIGRTSSFQFKGRAEDLRVIGRTLGVANILEGSVRSAGNKVRISVQLINAADGSNLWSDRYDRDLVDVFGVQEEIAREVVNALQVTLVGGAMPAQARPQTGEAYTLFLQGRYFGGRLTLEDSERAIAYYRQALEIDPVYAPAWAGLAREFLFFGCYPIEQCLAQAREAAQKAIELDPGLAQAHGVLGLISMRHDWDWAAADASFQRELALDPGNPTALLNAGILAVTLGRIDEAIELQQRAITHDPLRVRSYRDLALALFYYGRLEEAEASTRKALELSPTRFAGYSALARNLLLQGRNEEALEALANEQDEGFRLEGRALIQHGMGKSAESDAALEELIDRFASDYAYQVAEVYAFRGEVDQSFEWLERAYRQRDGGFAEFKGNPFFASLEPDPRHSALLGRLDLPD